MTNFDKITSYPYISGYTYRTFADHAICDPGDTEHMKEVCHGVNPYKVKNGDLLYVTGVKAKEFFTTIAPRIEADYFVITAQWDDGPDASFIPLLSPNLKKWYTINNHLDHPKVEGIPLGLQNRHWRRDGNVQSEPSTYIKRNDTPKDKFMMASFSVGNNNNERIDCIENAKRYCNDLTIRGFSSNDRQNDDFVNEYFDDVARHKFVLCPWGAGIDTHRLWEALYLGCVPVTKYHQVYKPFEGFPIIFVSSWKELGTIDWEEELEDFQRAGRLERRIYPDFWQRKINNELR